MDLETPFQPISKSQTFMYIVCRVAVVAWEPWSSSIIVSIVYFPFNEQSTPSGEEGRLNSAVVVVSKGWSDHSKLTPTGCSLRYQYHGPEVQGSEVAWPCGSQDSPLPCWLHPSSVYKARRVLNNRQRLYTRLQCKSEQFLFRSQASFSYSGRLKQAICFVFRKVWCSFMWGCSLYKKKKKKASLLLSAL